MGTEIPQYCSSYCLEVKDQPCLLVSSISFNNMALSLIENFVTDLNLIELIIFSCSSFGRFASSTCPKECKCAGTLLPILGSKFSNRFEGTRNIKTTSDLSSSPIETVSLI